MRIALVQGALPEDVALAPDPAVERMRAELQFGLTQEALEAGADLVTWSESAYPETVGREPWMALDLRRLLASHAGAEALVGALVEVPGAGRGPALTNSALLVDADGLRGRYDKVWLVPFGEYVPAARLFFWFDRLVDVVGDLKPGRSSEPLPSSRARLGAHVCYEAVLAQHVADLVRAGATLLVNVTNDGWFRGSAAPEQHLRFSVLRAVELRRTVVRCAHSGISAVVAPSGRVIARLGEGRRGVVLATVVPSKESTAYARWGDVPVAAGGIVAGLAVAFALGSRRLGARAGEVRP